jgi:hypothetical protein
VRSVGRLAHFRGQDWTTRRLGEDAMTRFADPREAAARRRLLAGALTEREILAEYPHLETDDIRECLRFAAASAMERELPLASSA